MKSFAFLLTFAGLAVAVNNDQASWTSPQTLTHYPGFDLDLSELRLVEFDGQAPIWITELEKINYRAQGLLFFDITETQDLGTKAHLRAQHRSPFPSPNKTDKVIPVLKTLSIDGPKANLEKFTSFRTRHYRSDTGRQSQQWLLSRISEITTQWGSESIQKLITIMEFNHSWGQNSIIARINGSSTTDDDVIVIGAHQDSINHASPFLPAPGADDDGSGTVTILEAYRALIAADFRPVRTVEFHWYAAEEGGLLGSQGVVRDYEARDVNVIAMNQFDMTAWLKEGSREEVGLVIDSTDASLTEFNKQLVEKYLDIPWVETSCGSHASSDHASWTKAGYPSNFIVESEWANIYQHVHSVDDRLDVSSEFSFSHMLKFSKLAVAFAIELGGWEIL